jgi:hypothetical protein
MDSISFAGKPSYYDISPRYRDLVITAGFDLHWLFRCTIKILMVTDGSHYDDGNGYNLSEVIKAIKADLPSYLQITITTADHHSGSPASGADIHDINLAIHNLNPYDQIWIIGVNRASNPGLTGAEVQSVWNFMQGGGGVFATGDHEDLGAALCGKIPRVRSMRRWYDNGDGPQGEPDAPSRDDSDHHKTTIGTDFDGTPQTIVPKKYTAWHSYLFGARSHPHPVLCGPDGPITVLPDHMHEGLIEVPSLTQNFTVNGATVTEYPDRNGTKLAPEVIATATNQFTGQPFGVIGAYDGHRVTEEPNGVGRIVVDATWHHYYNLNLNQFRLGFENVETALTNATTPTASDVTLANHYRQIRTYFQNIAVWLARKTTQNCIRRRGLWLVRWHYDLQMAVIPKAQFKGLERRIDYFFDLGTKAKDAFQRLAPQCETLNAFNWVVKELDLHRLLSPWHRDPDFEIDELGKMALPKTLDPELVQRIMMGGAIHAIADTFGEDMDEKRIDDGEFDKVAQQGAIKALRELVQSMDYDRETLQRFGAK